MTGLGTVAHCNSSGRLGSMSRQNSKRFRILGAISGCEVAGVGGRRIGAELKQGASQSRHSEKTGKMETCVASTPNMMDKQAKFSRLGVLAHKDENLHSHVLLAVKQSDLKRIEIRDRFTKLGRSFKADVLVELQDAMLVRRRIARRVVGKARGEDHILDVSSTVLVLEQLFKSGLVVGSDDGLDCFPDLGRSTAGSRGAFLVSVVVSRVNNLNGNSHDD